MYEVVYNSENRLKNIRRLIVEMILDLKRSRTIAFRIMARNIRSQYRQLLLGRLWALIPGLAASFVIVKIRNAGIINISQTDLPYPVYVVIGMMMWQTLLEALHGPIQAVTGERVLIRTQMIPVESVVLAKQFEVLFGFLIKFIFILGFLLWFGVSIKWTTVFMPLAVLIMILFATSIGLFLAPVNLLYQDVSKAIVFLGTIWLFFTPVIFPRPIKGSFATLVNVNPVTPLIVTIREMVTASQLTQLPAFFTVCFATLFLLFFAWVFFRVALPHAIERLNY